MFYCFADISTSKAANEQRHQGLIVFLQSTCCYRWISVFFLVNFDVYCSRLPTQFLLEHNYSSHVQKQKWEFDWHIKWQTCHSGVKDAWTVATVVSNLLEQFISSSISPFLGTTDNQFGFKADHGPDQCRFLLKQTVSYFVTQVSSVLLWLKITPTYWVMKNDDVWEEKYSSDISARRKITVWVDNQRTRSVATKLHAQMSLLVFCLPVFAVNFYYWMLLLRIMG